MGGKHIGKKMCVTLESNFKSKNRLSKITEKEKKYIFLFPEVQKN